MSAIDRSERERLDRDLDAWAALPTRLTAVAAEDFAFARTCIRTLESPLRAPDALHLAIASRQGYALATFDDNLADAGRELSLRVVGR
jgi:predicted nucleic acid-binding protein